MQKIYKELEQKVKDCAISNKPTWRNYDNTCSLNPAMQTMYQRTTCPYLLYQPTQINEGVFVCKKET